ncbi:HutD family protein [Inquilinus sp. CAU 1745]|uniref:HutD/Ves family protein n=1 Tax=Inquilinus sp. CAU 1745 TaxID=3140369 RepID=UPI00325B58B6
MKGAIRLLRPSDYRRMPWRNGGGETVEIARREENGATLWRVSIADVDRPGDFSAFPGLERVIAVADGVGMRLHVGSENPVTLTPEDLPFRFSGTAATRCELLEGPIRNFNLMIDPLRTAGSLARIAGPADHAIPATAGTILVHALAGPCGLTVVDETVEIDEGMTAMVEGMGAALHVRGQAMVATIGAVPS